MDFLEIFASGSYHSDIKILKILASHSEFMAFLENYKLILIGGQPNTKFS